MRIFKAALPLVFIVGSLSVASAQGAKPAVPNSWGKGAVEAAQTGPRGASEEIVLGNQGFANARHDPGESASHPTPPSGVTVPNPAEHVAF